MAELKGLRLVAGPGSLAPGELAAAGVSSDIAFAAPLAPQLQPFLGQPLTLGALARIEAVIVDYYRAHHRPFVNVAVPPQDVSNGTVRVVVTEYRVGKIRVLKNRWFAARLVRGDVRLNPGDTIDAARLEADLAWLNQNPFLTVDAITRPGIQPGQTDIDLTVHDKFPASVYAGYSDDGSPGASLYQWKFGALWGNAFGSGQQLAYQFTASPDFFTGRAARPDGSRGASFLAHALTATIQLPWRNTLQLIGSYEVDHPNIGPDFARTGYASQLSVRYVIPLPPARRLSQQLSLGYDYKATNNNLDFGGVVVSDQSTEIDQFPITYQASLGDAWGHTSLADTLVLSPGGLSGRNSDAAFQPGVNQAGVAFARARYAYDRLDLERDTILPGRFTWIAKASAQVASANLMPSEQLNIGGMETVRGYTEEVTGGSEGVLLSTELRAPAFSLLFREGASDRRDALQPDVFFDYGRVFNVRDIPGAPPAVALSSVGLGARYAIGAHVNLRVEYGVPLGSAPGLRRGRAFANFSIIVSP